MLVRGATRGCACEPLASALVACWSALRRRWLLLSLGPRSRHLPSHTVILLHGHLVLVRGRSWGCGTAQAGGRIRGVRIVDRMGKKNNAVTPAQRAMQAQIAKAVYDGMRLRGGDNGWGGGARADWDCAHCRTRANWASRTTCRGCQKPRADNRAKTSTTSTATATTRVGGGTTAGSGGGGKQAGVARSTWASIVARPGPARGDDAREGDGGGGGQATAKHGAQAASGAEQPGDGGPTTTQPRHDQGGRDDDDSIAAARRAVRADEFVLDLLQEQGLPSDDRRIVEATASLADSKKRLDAALASSPPPASALLTAERKVAAAKRVEEKASAAVDDAAKALREARAAHVQAIEHREAAEARMQDLRTAVGRKEGAEQQQLEVLALSQKLGTQLQALPAAAKAGNGELAIGQIQQHFLLLFKGLQDMLGKESPMAQPAAAAAAGSATTATATAPCGAAAAAAPEAAAAATTVAAAAGSNDGDGTRMQLVGDERSDAGADPIVPRAQNGGQSQQQPPAQQNLGTTTASAATAPSPQAARPQPEPAEAARATPGKASTSGKSAPSAPREMDEDEYNRILAAKKIKTDDSRQGEVDMQCDDKEEL